MDALLARAGEILLSSRRAVALTGAGVSVESGIPDFRSAGGLWDRFDPEEYATISAFIEDPEKVWRMLREMEEVVRQARPNKAHFGLGELERMGILQGVITQNIDNLHQEGGSRNVIEYHGNASGLTCLKCGARFRAEEKRDEMPPRCRCRKILKPDVVFFGEAIPPEALSESYRLAAGAGVLMVVGTSALVSPANTLPSIAKSHGAKIIEINKERTHLTGTLTDLFLQGSAGEILASLVETVRARMA